MTGSESQVVHLFFLYFVNWVFCLHNHGMAWKPVHCRFGQNPLGFFQFYKRWSEACSVSQSCTNHILVLQTSSMFLAKAWFWVPATVSTQVNKRDRDKSPCTKPSDLYQVKAHAPCWVLILERKLVTGNHSRASEGFDSSVVQLTSCVILGFVP